MKNFFSSLKEKLTGPGYDEMSQDADQPDYVELDKAGEELKSKIVVRPFQLEDFEDIKPVLDALREGHTIALINIKALKERDMIELKRAINKLKKTTDALSGEVAGFGEDVIIATPSFATIHRAKQMTPVREDTTIKEEFKE
jgi:SepF-like predicted cell division protein (DUF552 family)